MKLPLSLAGNEKAKEEHSTKHRISVDTYINPLKVIKPCSVLSDFNIGGNDVELLSSDVTLFPSTTIPTVTTFIVRVDGVSQEFNETFHLNIVGLSDNITSQFSSFTDELEVTILDSNGKWKWVISHINFNKWYTLKTAV